MSISDIARGAIRANLAIVALLGLYLASATLYLLYEGHHVSFGIINLAVFRLGIQLAFGAFFLFIGGITLGALRAGFYSPFRYMVGDGWPITARLLTRICYASPYFILLPLFFSAFGAVKQTMGTAVPFYADPWLAEADAVLFGGVEPWEYLHAVMGPISFRIVDTAYQFWFFVTFGALMIAAFMTTRDRLRAQFMVSYLLCWALLGSVLAVAFSSAGPCYMRFFYGDTRYEPLVAHVKEMLGDNNLFSAPYVQSMLLERYKDSFSSIGNGISAFPSLHVAIAVIVAIFGWSINRMLGAALWIFVAIVMVGSISLGWHYAADGIVPLILVPIIWHVTGRLISLFEMTSILLQRPLGGHSQMPSDLAHHAPASDFGAN